MGTGMRTGMENWSPKAQRVGGYVCLVIVVAFIAGAIAIGHIAHTSGGAGSTEAAACADHGGLGSAYGPVGDALVCPDGMVESWTNGTRTKWASCIGHGDPSQAYIGDNGVQCTDGTLVPWSSG